MVVWHNDPVEYRRMRALSPAAGVHRTIGIRPPQADAARPPHNEAGVTTPVATKIKLMRLGKMREPHYRIVVADARTKRDGRSIETIGEYHPKNDPSVIKVDAERVAYWLGVGAQPTEAVAAILRVTGDWQKYKGLPAPEPMKVAPPKPDKKALFNAALAEVSGGPDADTSGATTPRKRAAKAAPAEQTGSEGAETAPADASADS